MYVSVKVRLDPPHTTTKLERRPSFPLLQGKDQHAPGIFSRPHAMKEFEKP